MNQQMLNLDALQNAITALKNGLNVVNQKDWFKAQDNAVQKTLTAGVIQNFKFVYELSHKTLKRYLEMTATTPEHYDLMSFQDLIRSGNEHGLLLGNWVDWKGYRTMRGETSHTYDENVALKVFAKIPTFLAEANFLRDRLQEKTT